MLSDIAKNNLQKDQNVLGRKWATTYGGYFSDPGNIDFFISTVIPYLSDRPLDVLYAASASGLLGEKLLEQLGRGTLTLVDISKKHLNENINKKTKKICADLFTMDLGHQFDLILMRSSLDYFPSADLQVEVLQTIKQHLKKDGVFINQPAFISDPHERDVMSCISQDTRKIGDRYFQSTDLESFYRKAGFLQFKQIGIGKPMILTQQDHIDRYQITQKDIEAIQQMIPIEAESMHVTTTGYKLIFQFPIFLASQQPEAIGSDEIIK